MSNRNSVLAFNGIPLTRKIAKGECMTFNRLAAPFIACVALCGVLVAPALAGPYGDTLAKCLVKSTTVADKSTLVQWMFVTVALHPDVRRLSAASDAQRDELNMKTAKLFEGLLTDSCIAETREALRYEGESTIESSFSVLGQVASRELFANPAVASGLAEFGKYLDAPKLQRLLKPSE